MTLTVPTWDLVGVIADCLPFASKDEEMPMLHGVRVEWDGERLHALATDRYRIAWSQWHPDDDPPTDTQDDLWTERGGADDPWSVFLHLDDATELVKVYKLPLKQSSTPLTVDMDTDRGRLTIKRDRDTGHSAITAVFDGQLLADNSALGEVDQAAFTAKYLADFAKVRCSGPMMMRFTGPDRLVHVSIGERFVGAIMPVRTGETADGEQPTHAAQSTRDGGRP